MGGWWSCRQYWGPEELEGISGVVDTRGGSAGESVRGLSGSYMSPWTVMSLSSWQLRTQREEVTSLTTVDAESISKSCLSFQKAAGGSLGCSRSSGGAPLPALSSRLSGIVLSRWLAITLWDSQVKWSDHQLAHPEYHLKDPGSTPPVMTSDVPTCTCTAPTCVTFLQCSCRLFSSWKTCVAG